MCVSACTICVCVLGEDLVFPSATTLSNSSSSSSEDFTNIEELNAEFLNVERYNEGILNNENYRQDIIMKMYDHD